MDEYIEKAELIKKLCFETAEWCYSPTIKIIKEFPTADVRSVKYGKWIDVYTWTMFHEFKSSGKGERFWCSGCEQGQKHKSNYCPNCGADMRGDAE